MSIFVSTGPFRLNVIASGQGALSSWRGNLPTGTHKQGGGEGEAGFYRVADQPFQVRSSVVRSVGMGGVKVVDEAFQLILGWAGGGISEVLEWGRCPQSYRNLRIFERIPVARVCFERWFRI